MRHSLTTLRIFVSVAECGNLTHAAAREHLAVSAISKRIGELEELAGTPLLQRKARGVALTAAGLSLLRHARKVLQDVQTMEAELGQYAGGVRGHVRVHAVASALTQFLPEEIEAFLTAYPLVQISLEERTSKAIANAITDGTADVGVVADAAVIGNLHSIPYHRDRLAIGVPVDHPLTRRRSVRFRDLTRYPFVGPRPDSSLADLLAHAARECGQPIQQPVQASSFDAMCRLVETRLGITMLPTGVLAPHVAARRIAVVQLAEKWAWRQLYLVVRGADELSPIAQTLIADLQKSAKVSARSRH
ncbi:MAG: LysR substrate-binding domain-containing protein [Burkholderiales bacterium]